MPVSTGAFFLIFLCNGCFLCIIKACSLLLFLVLTKSCVCRLRCLLHLRCGLGLGFLMCPAAPLVALPPFTVVQPATRFVALTPLCPIDPTATTTTTAAAAASPAKPVPAATSHPPTVA